MDDHRRESEKGKPDQLIPDEAAFNMRQVMHHHGWWREFIGILRDRPINEILAILAVVSTVALAWHVDGNELPQLGAKLAFIVVGLVAACRLSRRDAQTPKNDSDRAIEP